MTDQKEKTSALVADDCSTQPNSPDLGKLDSVFGPSGTTSATENAIAATTTTDTTTTTQPNEVDIEALRQTSRHGSVLNQPVKVPRSNRRGLFGRLTILAEVEDPKSYPRGTKWFITFVVAIAGMAAPLGSTIIFREDFLVLMNRTPTNRLRVQRQSLKSRMTLKPPRP